MRLSHAAVLLSVPLAFLLFSSSHIAAQETSEKKTSDVPTCSETDGSGGEVTEEKKAIQQIDKTSRDVVTVDLSGKITVSSSCNPDCEKGKLKNSDKPCPPGSVTMNLPNGKSVTCSKSDSACGKAAENIGKSKALADALGSGDVGKAGKLVADEFRKIPGIQTQLDSAVQEILQNSFTENLPDSIKPIGKDLQKNFADSLRAIRDGEFGKLKEIGEDIKKNPAIQAFVKDPKNFQKLIDKYVPKEAKEQAQNFLKTACGFVKCPDDVKKAINDTFGGEDTKKAKGGNKSRRWASLEESRGLQDGLLSSTETMESGKGCRQNVKARGSSAAGCFQWTAGSWRKETQAMYGRSLDPSLRYDPETSARVTADYAQRMLSKHGSLIKQAGLDQKTGYYLIHHLGEGGGTAFMRKFISNPNASVASVLPRSIINGHGASFRVRTSSGWRDRSVGSAVQNFARRLDSGVSYATASGDTYGGGGEYSYDSGYGGGESTTFGGGSPFSFAGGSFGSLFSGFGSGSSGGNSSGGGYSPVRFDAYEGTSYAPPKTVVIPPVTDIQKTLAPTQSNETIVYKSPNPIVHFVYPGEVRPGEPITISWAAINISETSMCRLMRDEQVLALGNTAFYNESAVTEAGEMRYQLRCFPLYAYAPTSSYEKSFTVFVRP